MKDVIGMGNVEVGRLVHVHVRVRVRVCVQAIKTYSRSGGTAPLILHFALDTGQRSTSSCGRITTEKEPGHC